MREFPEPPVVVVALEIVAEEGTVERTVVVDEVTAMEATVVVDETAAAGANVPNGDEPRPPETVTTARARSTPAASPIPKRFPSITVYPP